MQRVNELMVKYDVIIFPICCGDQADITNLTLKEVLTIPSKFNKLYQPTSVAFIGKLNDEATSLATTRA